MSHFSRRQVIELLEIEETFLLALERESIAYCDTPPDTPAEYSAYMLERIRVAANLVRDLEVNLEGVAVILSLREELATLRTRLAGLAAEIERTHR
jgi:hypothetical protein